MAATKCAAPTLSQEQLQIALSGGIMSHVGSKHIVCQLYAVCTHRYGLKRATDPGKMSYALESNAWEVSSSCCAGCPACPVSM